MTEVTVHDVVVIGAGLSGLSAAKVLLEGEVDVLVLEANDRVGGRTWTVKNPQIGWADLGGSYIRPTQNHALRMIKEFGLQMYSADETGSKVFFDGFSGTRTIFKQSPNLGFLANLDLNHIFRLLDQLGGQLPENEPWNAPQAELWDQMTFKMFVEKNTVTRRAREYMRNFVATMVTAEAYQCSLLWFLWFIKQCGGTKTLFASGGLEWKLVGGAAQLSELLAQTLGTEKVLLNEPVCSIDQAEDQSIVVRTVNGSVFCAKYLIMATPPAVQQKIHYRPALPPMRNQLLQRLPQGSVYKCMVYYENAFWRDLNLNGCLVFVGDDQQYPVPYTFEDSKPDGSKPAILGFIPGDRARKLTLLTREERLRIICSSFAKAFQTDLATKPVHYEEYNWMADQYCGGGYMMNANVGFLTRFGPHLAEPVGRMFFAGTECATHWSGYMDGAIQAGEKAARQVMLQLDLIKADQVDQSEPISREYPPPGPFDSTLFQLYAPSGKTFVKGLTITSMTVVSIVAVTFGLLRHCPRSIRA